MKLEFKPVDNGVVTGIQAKHDFENGYGVSVIQNTISYGASEGLYELAVTKVRQTGRMTALEKPNTDGCCHA